MARPRLLFLTDRGERHQKIALRGAPPQVETLLRRRPDAAEMAALLPTVAMLVSERNQPVTAAMVAAAENLHLIVRLGSLSHDIAVAEAKARGVRVSVQPVTGCIYAAEHLVMMTLAVLKRLGRSLHAARTAMNGDPSAVGARRTDEDTFAYNWPGYADLRGLTGKTVAILGMGEIGVELARRLKGFAPGAVLYHKRTPYPEPVERELGVASADRETCLARADVLVCLLPYGPETDLSLGAAAFGRMKRGAALVHGGSGSVLDEGALLAALRSGRLSGAALDTYEWEPLAPEHPLAAYARDPASNLLLTPHVAGAEEPDYSSAGSRCAGRFSAPSPAGGARRRPAGRGGRRARRSA
jgi:phosphoglycerate dehydrogenase-like enzyme